MSNMRKKLSGLKERQTTEATPDWHWDTPQEDSVPCCSRAIGPKGKQKEKNRAPPVVAPPEVQHQQPIAPVEPTINTQTFKVSHSALQVFSGLLDKSKSSGPINWVDFTSAMTQLGFASEASYGSVWKFMPPSTMSIHRPLTVHRPHMAKIEGGKKLHLSQRLRDVYGWDSDTFELR